MSGDIKDKVEKSINQSGYPLELHISSSLKNNFDIWNNLYYFDYDEEKSRTIDIAAHIRLRKEDYSPFIAHLAIECKKSINKAWVFFGSETVVDYLYSGQLLDHSQIAKNDFVDGSVIWRFNDKLSLHYGDRRTPSFLAHSYQTVKIDSTHHDDDKQDKIKDNLFEALNQVTKYTVYQMNNAIKHMREKFSINSIQPAFFLIYPIIVFDGNMFTGELNGDKVKLTGCNHVILEYRYQPPYVDAPKSFFVDVVKKEYFPHFLNSIETEISNIHRSLKKSSSEITEDVKSYQKYFDTHKKRV